MGLAERRLRRQLHRSMRDLKLTPPYDPQQMCAALSRHRGRPVELRARDAAALGAFGVLIALPHVDVIVYQDNLSQGHQDHIVRHELVHLLRGHLRSDDPAGGLTCGQLVETSRPSRAEATVYDAWQEWEAETGAAILAEWSDVVSAGRPATDLEETDVALMSAFTGSRWAS